MLLVSKIVMYRDQKQAFYFEIWKRISGIKTRIGYMINHNIVWLSTEEIQLEVMYPLLNTSWIRERLFEWLNDLLKIWQNWRQISFWIYQSLLLLFVDQGYCFTRQSIKRNSINHSMHQKLSISGKLINLKDKSSMKKSWYLPKIWRFWEIRNKNEH